jgi:hypothetical protein
LERIEFAAGGTLSRNCGGKWETNFREEFSVELSAASWTRKFSNILCSSEFIQKQLNCNENKTKFP